VSVVNFGSISEAITVLVHPFGFLIFKVDGVNTELGQGVKLAGIADAIVIAVLPQSELREDFIMALNYAISVATVWRIYLTTKRILAGGRVRLLASESSIMRIEQSGRYLSFSLLTG